MKIYKLSLKNQQKYLVYLQVSTYLNNQTSLQLFNQKNGDPILTASVCVPEIFLQNDELVIKDYSENEGILDFLISNGIVELTGKKIQLGYVKSEIVKLLL